MQYQTEQQYEVVEEASNNYMTLLSTETICGETLINTCECPSFGRDANSECNHRVRRVSTFALQHFGMIIGLTFNLLGES